MEGLNSAPLRTPTSIYDLIKRPELNYEILKDIDPERPELLREIRIEVEIQIKYEGYIAKQMAQIAQFKSLKAKLPEDLDYNNIRSLSNEAKQKLNNIRPESVGQASRISGVSPSDINVLLIYLEQLRRAFRSEKMTDVSTMVDIGKQLNINFKEDEIKKFFGL